MPLTIEAKCDTPSLLDMTEQGLLDLLSNKVLCIGDLSP